MIEQAKGALARMHDIDVDLAFQLMRRYARSGHHRLVDVAEAVLTNPGGHPALTQRRPAPGS